MPNTEITELNEVGEIETETDADENTPAPHAITVRLPGTVTEVDAGVLRMLTEERARGFTLALSIAARVTRLTSPDPTRSTTQPNAPQGHKLGVREYARLLNRRGFSAATISRYLKDLDQLHDDFPDLLPSPEKIQLGGMYTLPPGATWLAGRYRSPLASDPKPEPIVTLPEHGERKEELMAVLAQVLPQIKAAANGAPAEVVASPPGLQSLKATTAKKPSAEALVASGNGGPKPNVVSISFTGVPDGDEDRVTLLAENDEHTLVLQLDGRAAAFLLGREVLVSIRTL